MENEIEVSVMVITYNHENYIKECLESILCQKTNFPFEIMISDDASIDKTPEILKQYKEKYPEKIKLTLRTENVGPTRNSYELLMKMRGKYIAACEGDDYWCDENKLQKQYDFMETHPQFIGCSHKVRLVDKAGKTKKKQKLYWVSDKKIVRLKDFQGIFVPGHTSALFRKNIYREGGDYSILYQANPFLGDRTAALYYLSRGDFYQINEVMSCYRQVAEIDGENVSSKLYVNNRYSVSCDFEYTLQLEKFTKNRLKEKVNFDYHKCELLLRLLHNAKGQYMQIDGKHFLENNI